LETRPHPNDALLAGVRPSSPYCSQVSASSQANRRGAYWLALGLATLWSAWLKSILHGGVLVAIYGPDLPLAPLIGTIVLLVGILGRILTMTPR